MSGEQLPQFNNYTLQRLIGQGGMGNVYLAEDLLGKQRAIKIVHPDLAKKDEFRGRFLNEAHVLDRLGRHPNVVFLWGLGEENDMLYIVMDYVEGEDVAVLLSEKTGLLPAETAIPIIRQTAEAISFAHERGVVHRDIKPSNILVSRGASDGAVRITDAAQVKVMDFGIARARHDPRLTTHGVIGTPDFMAPELFEDGHEATEFTDQYSLGIAAYEMVTARVPFSAGSDSSAASLVQVANMKLAGPPPPPSTHYPPLDKGLEEVIMTAIARRPEERFSSVREMSDALDAVWGRLGLGGAVWLTERIAPDGSAGPVSDEEFPPTDHGQDVGDQQIEDVPAISVSVSDVDASAVATDSGIKLAVAAGVWVASLVAGLAITRVLL
jgi:serine/threonine protein kinase